MNTHNNNGDMFQHETWSADRVKELTMSRIQKTTTGAKPRRTFSIVAAVLVAAMLTATTAFAAWTFLKPAEVVEQVEKNSALAAAFESDSAINVNHTITSGGYDFSFLGMVSGAGLQDVDDNLDIGATYAVLAITNTDGSPFTNENYYDAGLHFFISPQIKGIAPWQGGSIVMNGGGYAEKIIDGVLYRIISCDNVEIFADRGLYLVASTEIFYSNEAFDYNAQTGEIVARSDFDGASVVFDLPLDKSKADPAKAAAYLASLEAEAETDDTDALPRETPATPEQPEDGTPVADGEIIITTDSPYGFFME
jgi:hypothetical protein